MFCYDHHYFRVLEIIDETSRGWTVSLEDDEGNPRTVWITSKRTRLLNVRDRDGNWYKQASIPQWLAVKLGLMARDAI